MPRYNQRRNGMHRWMRKQNIVPVKKESKPPKFEKIKEINIDRLVPNPNQPRKEFGDEIKINELAKSIKQEGLIQPIIVRKKKNKFEIIVGERRWRACKATGINKIPAIVRDVSDHHLLLQSLIENLHRSDLSSIERENAVYELWSSGQYKTQKDVGDALGSSKSTINEIIEAKEFRDRSGSPGELSTKIIKQTRGIKDDNLRMKIIKKIKSDNIPSHEVSDYVKQFKKPSWHKHEKKLRQALKSADNENIINTQIQKLEQNIDELTSTIIEPKTIASLNKTKKKQLKAKLSSAIQKLNEVIEKI